MRTRFLCALLSLAAAACSPEAGRTRGGGPGADVGNLGDPVTLRERPAHDDGTPDLLPGR